MKITDTRERLLGRINSMILNEAGLETCFNTAGTLATMALQTATEKHEATAAIYDDILSLETTDLRSGQMDFFLHLQIREDSQLDESIRPFIDFLKSDGNLPARQLCRDSYKKNMKVIICCTSGATSTFIAEMINEEARNNLISIEAAGMPWHQVKDVADEYDAILMAPQISYMEKKFKKEFGDKASVIPAMDFATFNAAHIIHTVMTEKNSGNADRKSRCECRSLCLC